MSITNYDTKRFSGSTLVTVTSDLTGTVYYHWYIDGSYVGKTLVNYKMFYLRTGDQARIEVNDTNDSSYDGIANAPEGYPARKTISWIRILASNITHYIVEQRLDSGAWEQIAKVIAQRSQWIYKIVTPRLVDLGLYEWRVRAVDEVGNEGGDLATASERVVRRPDSPDFNIAFDSGTTKVTFSEVA